MELWQGATPIPPRAVGSASTPARPMRLPPAQGRTGSQSVKSFAARLEAGGGRGEGTPVPYVQYSTAGERDTKTGPGRDGVSPAGLLATDSVFAADTPYANIAS